MRTLAAAWLFIATALSVQPANAKKAIDLTVTDVRVNPASPMENDAMVLQAAVKNIGRKKASNIAFKVTFLIDGVCPGGDCPSATSYATLAKGGTVDIYTQSRQFSGVKAGAHTITATVSATSFSETNISNNTFQNSFQIAAVPLPPAPAPTAPPLPDAGTPTGRIAIVSQDSSPIITRFNLPQTQPGMFFELPSWQISGGWNQHFISTAWTWHCASPDNLLSGPVTFNANYCAIVTRSEAHFFQPDQIPPNTDWRRNYQGVFSVFPLGGKLIAISHGENKNEKIGESYYQNTINKNILAQNCYSGYRSSGIYEDCWDSYNAFVNLSWINSTAENGWGMQMFNDDGPIIWPSAGYVNSAGEKVSSGIRHPSAIVTGGFMYIYYLDSSFRAVNGRGWGFKAARASIGSDGKPGAFKTYYKGAWSENALPKGFTKENIQAFFSKEGPLADVIVGSPSTNRFAVASIRNTSYFIGVEESVEGDIWQIKLRISSDLMHWSDPVHVLSKPGGWNAGTLHYPVLLDASGRDNTSIDLNNFVVYGATWGTAPSYIRVQAKWQ